MFVAAEGGLETAENCERVLGRRGDKREKERDGERNYS